MGFFKNILSKNKDTHKERDDVSEDTGSENIGSMVTEVADDLIKKLSGKNVKRTKILVDNVVVISNAAGGTGASTIVSNVAYMANKKGFKTLVIDLNILYPTQHSYFGLRQKVEKTDIISYLSGRASIGDCIENSGGIGLIYANNRGLMDNINMELDVYVENFRLAIDKLRQLFDLILIDTPMIIDHTLINTAFYIADQIYLVWDEGISSIANTERIRRNMMFSGIDSYTKMKVILNKRTNIHYTKYPFQKLNIELEQILPFEVDIIENSLKSVIFCHKGASSSKNAKEFYNGIDSLTHKILRNGGYIEDGPA